MSYILEALKKSEKERKKEEVPDLLAEHSHQPFRRPPRKSRTGWFAGICVLLFVFLGGSSWFWWQSRQGTPIQPVEETLVRKSPIPPPPSVTPPLPIVASPAPVEPVRLPMKEMKALVPVVSEVIVEEEMQPAEVLSQEDPEPALPFLKELPLQMQNKIPKLSFAGHVYAEDKGRRMIVINNRIVREGDFIGDDLFLEQITPVGVVLRYKVLAFQVRLF